MRRLRNRSRIRHRASSEVAPGVLDDGPQVLADGGPHEREVRVRRLAEDHPRRARDRAGPERARRRELRTQVERAEAGEQLARERTLDAQRGPPGRHTARPVPLAAPDLPDDQRPLLRPRTPPAPPSPPRRAELYLVPAVEFELAQVRC